MLTAIAMRLRSLTSSHHKHRHSVHGHAKYSSLDDNLVQRWWPCFAIVSCAILFSFVFYTVVFLTEEQQTFLTYIYPRDVSSPLERIHHSQSEQEKLVFWSTLQHLHREQQQLLQAGFSHHEPRALIRHRTIEDCHLQALQNTSDPTHCVQVQLVLAAHRRKKNSGHADIAINSAQGIVQEYNGTKHGFNFLRVDPNELLMTVSMNAHDFEAHSKHRIFHYIRQFIGLDDTQWSQMEHNDRIGFFACVDWHATRAYHGFHAVMLNKYGIGNYSGLFVPHLWDLHGQFLDFDALLLAMQFLNLFPTGSRVRVGYNSLGAFASVNHLHFQFWHIGDDNEQLPIETAPVRTVATKAMDRVQVSEVNAQSYPLHALLFQLNEDRVTSTNALFSDLDHLARTIYVCVEYLQRHSIAFNLVMVPAFPFKVFVIPRQSQSQMDEFEFTTMPGFPETALHIMMVNETQWEQTTVETVWREWRTKLSIQSQNEWHEIIAECSSMDM